MDGAADTPVENAAAKPRRKGIQSLVTGFQVLDFLVKARQPVPLRDIATGTGLAASKLQFYLISLLEIGAVKQDAQTGFYGLGPYTLQLGIAGLQQFDVYQSAYGRMQALADETGLTVFLGVWGNQGPTIVHRAENARNRGVFDLRLGAVLPVLTSALGQLFLCYLPRDITACLLGSPAPAAFEIDRIAALIRAQRLSISRGGLLAAHTALSAPVFDHQGKILAGLTIMGPDEVLSDQPGSAIARNLISVADTISKEAGSTTRHYLTI